MGGHALKKVIASRINLDQYNSIKQIIGEKVGKYLNLDFVFEVPGKCDFGDIDVLYNFKTDENLKKNITELIQDIFNPVEIIVNGPVCSFAYKLDEQDNIYFQVDFIFCKDLYMSKFYFSYGDLGGIIGRICQHIGLTYGSDGLWVCVNSQTINNYKNTDNIILNSLEKISGFLEDASGISGFQEDISKSIQGKIILSNQPIKICDYLGLDIKVWTKGFELKDEIFTWVTKSKYFKKDSFRALDYEHRHRAEKRPMYCDFLNYVFADEKNFTIEKGNSSQYINLNYQIEAIEYFNMTSQLNQMILNELIRLKRKEKFSGKKFIELGINDKQIKTYIDEFKIYLKNKYYFTKDFNDFENWLDSKSIEQVQTEINNFVSNKNK